MRKHIPAILTGLCAAAILSGCSTPGQISQTKAITETAPHSTGGPVPPQPWIPRSDRTVDRTEQPIWAEADPAIFAAADTRKLREEPDRHIAPDRAETQLATFRPSDQIGNRTLTQVDGEADISRPGVPPVEPRRGAVDYESDVNPLPLPPPPASPRRRSSIPLRTEAPLPRMRLDSRGDLISLSVRDAPLDTVLSLLAEQQGLNVVTGSELNKPLTVTLNHVTVEQALDSILRTAGCTWHMQDNIIHVSSLSGESHVDPIIQGRMIRVFQLDYVSAADVAKVAEGLLSPAGSIFSAESESKNSRRTGESLIVEDLPAYLQRIEEYIGQADQPPRQVLIEAHILKVQLSDDMNHGVNFNYLADISDTQLRVQPTGFANPLAGTGMLFSVQGSELHSLVEALQVTNDAKTLASPKVLVLNGQEARIQIGERLGFFVTTTTQTSTLQQVEFLDVGILLRVKPQITVDNRVIMTVQPEISTGQVNENTGLPDKATTEVETSVILNDGCGIIIGGLIQEADIDRQSKVPLLGDLWGVGRVFQKRRGVRERSEIIVALLPRVVPCGGGQFPREQSELYRTATPLFDSNLRRTDRTLEGSLPDAVRDPRRLRMRRLPDAIRNLNDPSPLPPSYYIPPRSELDHHSRGLHYDPNRSPSNFMLEPAVETSPPYEEFPDAQ